MRISDCSSDVCSSDLPAKRPRQALHPLPLVLCCLGFACHRATLLQPGADYSSFSIEFCAAQAGGSATLSATEAPRRPIGRSGPVVVSRKRSEEHTSELQSLMRISYAVFCLKKKK